MQRGLDELGLVEELAGVSGRVQLGELQRRGVRHVLLEHAQRQHRQRRVEQVVHRDEHLVEHRLNEDTFVLYMLQITYKLNIVTNFKLTE